MGLHATSRRAASLAQEAPSDIADALGDLAVDADTLAASVEVLISRQRPRRLASGAALSNQPPNKKVTYAQHSKKENKYLARYEDDPYAAFANEGGPGIQGKRLT